MFYRLTTSKNIAWQARVKKFVVWCFWKSSKTFLLDAARKNAFCRGQTVNHFAWKANLKFWINNVWSFCQGLTLHTTPYSLVPICWSKKERYEKRFSWNGVNNLTSQLCEQPHSFIFVFIQKRCSVKGTCWISISRAIQRRITDPWEKAIYEAIELDNFILLRIPWYQFVGQRRSVIKRLSWNGVNNLTISYSFSNKNGAV